METKHINEQHYRQLYQAADRMLDRLWLRQTEALDFLNDASLFLYALAKGQPDFPGTLEHLKCRNILERILNNHRELEPLNYRFGQALQAVNEDVWHDLRECLRLAASDRQPEESAARLFDYLLQQMYVREKIGNFLTPRTLADMMAQILNPEPGQIVLDPVCGSGRLLIAAAESCKDCHCIGIDLDEKIRTTAFFNMAFHGVAHGKLYGEDFLREPRKEQGDVIMANPPYSDDIHETIHFVEKIMDALRQGGRCGILVPEGFLTSVGNRDVVAVRQDLLCRHSLEGVISLPRKLYRPYTISKSSLILLKKQPALPGEAVFFGHVPEYDGAESEFSDAVYEQDMRRIAKAWKFRKQGQRTKNDKVGEEIFWRASLEEIKEKGYIFGADHYRKSDYTYKNWRWEGFRERILAGQEELERDMDHYFREDSVI